LFKYRYHIILASLLLSIVLWLSLNLNQVYEIEKSVPLKFNVNKPFAISGNIPLSLEVKFKGTGWNLIRLYTSLNLDFIYNYNARKTENFTILTKEYLENSFGVSQNLNIIGVYPETLYVRIVDYEEKYVKLLPNIQIDCKEGYQVVGKPILEPDSIKIGGAIDILRNLNFITTNEQLFKNVNASIVKNISISDSLSNLLWRSQNEVRLNVNVELTAEKEFSNIEIKVPNVPADKEVLLIPQTITLQIKGGVNQLASVDPSKINAVIDYYSILNDTTGSLSPSYQLPEGCSVISMKPDKIQYVIKKKPI
jgi:YbbR domain-containing protein